jgi:AcrR family transcriptional regulator
MARKSVARRREEIISTTLDVIQRQGLPAVRTANLASALGVSTALIFYHFSTLENLIATAFDHAAERDLERLAEARSGPGTALARLGEVLRMYGPTGDASGWTLWIEGWAASLRDPVLRELSQRLDLRWREAVTDLIAEGVAAGEFRCPDPRGAAWRITALLDGLAVQLVVRHGTLSEDEMAAWVRQAVARELDIDPSVLAD